VPTRSAVVSGRISPRAFATLARTSTGSGCISMKTLARKPPNTATCRQALRLLVRSNGPVIRRIVGSKRNGVTDGTIDTLGLAGGTGRTAAVQPTAVRLGAADP